MIPLAILSLQHAVEAYRVVRRRGCHIFLDNRLSDCAKVVGRPPFTPHGDSCYSLRGRVNTWAIVRLERLRQLKNPMTSSGIETATFRFVA
jgi:hypothetical protein